MKKFKIGKEQVDVLFGVGAVFAYCEMMDCDLDGIDLAFTPGKKQLVALPSLVLAGINNAANFKEEDSDITLAQVQHYIDEMPQDTLRSITSYFLDSKYMGKKMSEHLGINETDTDHTQAKKKPSRSAK